MSRRIRILGVVLSCLFLAVFVQLNRVQVFGAEDLRTNPDNSRGAVSSFNSPRGSIQTSDGVVVARSVPSEGRFTEQREYPEGALFAGITGYLSFEFGTEGAERSYDALLSGTSDDGGDPSIAALFPDSSKTADLTLTVSQEVQQVAVDALGERAGSVAAIDPRTGAVLALWSYPSYDPNPLASHDLDAARAARVALLADPADPLLVKAYQERFFPGSTFKIITASAGLRSGKVTQTSPSYPFTDEYLPPLTTVPVRNFGGETCGGTLPRILEVSCNSAFAQMAVDVGPEQMVAAAEAYGFNSAPPLDLPRPAASAFPPVSFFDRNTPALAQAGIGQNDVQGTPLQMAMMAGAVANRGIVMAPHVLLEARDADGGVVQRPQPTPWRQAISTEQAGALTEDMIGVVESGTATRLQIPGILVAGKTGTAQLGTTPPASHAWIVGFAPADNPRVAVAVLVEAQPGVSEVTGGTVAAPIAKAVMEAVLASPDPLAGGRG